MTPKISPLSMVRSTASTAVSVFFPDWKVFVTDSNRTIGVIYLAERIPSSTRDRICCSWAPSRSTSTDVPFDSSRTAAWISGSCQIFTSSRYVALSLSSARVTNVLMYGSAAGLDGSSL